MPKKSLDFSAFYPRNSVSLGECVVLCVVVEIVSSLESCVLCIIVRLCVVILQV